MESAIGLYKTELIKRKGPWKTLADVEVATAEYIDWFNHRRLHGAIGHIPPAEHEANYYAQTGPGLLAGANNWSLHETRLDSVSGKFAKDHWPTKALQDSVHVHAATWVRMLRQVNAGTSLAVVLPVPLDYAAAARVGSHLRAAIAKVNNTDYDGAVTEARRAIDALTEIRPAWPTENDVRLTKAVDRTFDQRLAMLKHALFGLASPAAHGDEVAASFNWSRETALAVIAGVAALAACGKPE
jgi:hypothetical protein